MQPVGRLGAAGVNVAADANRTLRFVAVIGVLWTAALMPVCADGAEPRSLQCRAGPLAKTYGNGPWLLYGCDDDRKPKMEMR